MSNLAEEMKYLEWKIFQLSCSEVRRPTPNKGRSKMLDQLRKRQSDINKIMYPPKKKRY